MKRLLDTAEDKTQLLGPDMINIIDLPMQQKMSIMSSVTTLTIDIQKNALHNWTEFQHQLAIIAETILDMCVQKRPSTRLHIPKQIGRKILQTGFFTSLISSR